MISMTALTGGALLGASLGLTVRALRPARPSLAQILQRTHSPAPPAPVADEGASAVRLAERAGARLLHNEALASRMPLQDLRLLEMTPARLLGRCLLFGVVGLMVPQWLLLLLALVGSAPPVAVPVLASLVFGLFLAAKCFHEVHEQANALREEYRYAIASVMKRAAMARVADAGAGEALYRAASAGDCRALVRIRQVLERTRYAGTSPWTALEALGQELGIEELSNPAQTLALAGEEGASVHDTLQHQAASQRASLQAARKAEANAASERMVLPVLAVALVMVIFVGGPAFARILQV